MRTVGFSFWLKVGLSAGLFGMAGLLLASASLREMLLGAEPSDAVLGPVVAVLVQGGLLVSIVAATSCRSRKSPRTDVPPPRTAVTRTASASSDSRWGVGAFDLAGSVPD